MPAGDSLAGGLTILGRVDSYGISSSALHGSVALARHARESCFGPFVHTVVVSRIIVRGAVLRLPLVIAKTKVLH